MVSLQSSSSLILTSSFLPVTLWCDNKAAEASTQVSCTNKLRHMTEVREHYVRECVARNLVKISWIPSKQQIADIFTTSPSLRAARSLSLLSLGAHFKLAIKGAYESTWLSSYTYPLHPPPRFRVRPGATCETCSFLPLFPSHGMGTYFTEPPWANPRGVLKQISVT